MNLDLTQCEVDYLEILLSTTKLECLRESKRNPDNEYLYGNDLERIASIEDAIAIAKNDLSETFEVLA